MNGFDIILGIPLLYAAYRGFREGIIVQLGGIAGLFIGVYFAFRHSSAVGQWLHTDPPIAAAVGFVVILLAVLLVMALLGHLIKGIFKLAGLGPIDAIGGILLGVLSAKYTGKWLDGIIRVLSYLGIVSPAFVWGVLFMLLFGYLIPILPTTGRIGQSVAAPAVITGMYTVDFLLAGNVAGWWDAFRHLILPSISAFTMGLGVLVATVPIGSILGLIAGYWRGRWFSTLIMRITDVFLALPPIILALCVCAVLRPTLLNSLLAMCFAWWPWYTRLTYSMATSLRNEMYIKSAELLGASKVHILFREILPNCTGSILTKATLDMGWVILNGATLSFVGLGEQPPAPALGTMVSDGAKYLPAQWWISIFPALAIMLIVLGFNLMGDGVKDMLSGKE